MSFRSLIALLLIFIAASLQFLLGSAGMFTDLMLSALIAFAFLFEWPELSIYVLVAVFMIDWQPALTPTLVVFAAIPFAAYAFRKLFAWAPWAGIPLMTILGFVAFYLAIAPGMFANAAPSIVLDILGALIFGEVTFAVLMRAER